MTADNIKANVDQNNKNVGASLSYNTDLKSVIKDMDTSDGTVLYTDTTNGLVCIIQSK